MSIRSFNKRRVAGLVVATSGLLFALSNLLGIQTIIIPMLLAIALVLIQVFNESPGNWLGRIGVAISLLALLAMQLDLRPILPNLFADQRFLLLLLFVVFSFGNILLGISLNRSGSFQRFTGTALSISPIIIVFTGSNLPYSVTLIWIGIQHIRGPTVNDPEKKPSMFNDNDSDK